jgi:hypothetical protein
MVLLLKDFFYRAMCIAGGYLSQDQVLTMPFVVMEFELQVIVGWLRGCHTAWLQ